MSAITILTVALVIFLAWAIVVTLTWALIHGAEKIHRTK